MFGMTRPRILVVDDDAALVAMMDAALRSSFRVSGFSDPAEALATIADGESFDAVVCDVTMPFIDGLEFRRRALRLCRDLESRFVFITAMLDVDVGGAPVLIKPFRLEALRDLVRLVCPEWARRAA